MSVKKRIINLIIGFVLYLGIAYGLGSTGVIDAAAAKGIGVAVWMIYWWLNDYFLIILDKYINGHTYALNNTWNIGEPLALYLPLVMIFNPLDNGSPEFIWYHGVTKQ